MFLTGCFMDSMHTHLTNKSLELVGVHLPKTINLPHVKSSLYTLVTERLDKEWSGMSTETFAYFGWDTYYRKEVLSKLDKIRKGEYSLGVREDGTGRLPYGVVDEESFDTESGLVPESAHRWEVFLNKQSIEAFDFQEDLKEQIDEYNRVSKYLQAVYGVNLRYLLRSVLAGEVESQEYLVDILSEENDKVFVDTLAELLHYDEFKDFLYGEGELKLVGGSVV